MYPIVRKEELNETTTLMDVEAPLVARKAKPGQFIIFRIDEDGERRATRCWTLWGPWVSPAKPKASGGRP